MPSCRKVTSDPVSPQVNNQFPEISDMVLKDYRETYQNWIRGNETFQNVPIFIPEINDPGIKSCSCQNSSQVTYTKIIRLLEGNQNDWSGFHFVRIEQTGRNRT